jgi:hypothetical protein
MSADYMKRFVAMTLIISLPALPAWARHGSRAVKANVRFVAASTFLRGTWGLNQDTYLAEMTISSRRDEPFLVRLVDEYPNELPALAHNVVTSPSGTTLRVLRDNECDRPFHQMLIRTAPGDPLAILLEPLSYQPHLEIIPHRTRSCHVIESQDDETELFEDRPQYLKCDDRPANHNANEYKVCGTLILDSLCFQRPEPARRRHEDPAL